MIEKVLVTWFGIRQSIRYLLVGGYNTLFSIILFAVLYKYFGTNVHYILLLAISHCVSVLNSTLNFNYFVFKSSTHFVIKYLKTNVVYLLYFIINAILLKVMCNTLHMQVIYSQIVIVIILIFPFYLIHKLFSFE